jgi:ureidoglycolate hydrolase
MQQSTQASTQVSTQASTQISTQVKIQPIVAQAVTSELFRPYGQVIWPTPDRKAFDSEDAQLELSQGIPRFYIMQLPQRGRQFGQMTRHQRCTQCLGALHGVSWLIAVAPPASAQEPFPQPETIKAFQIPGNCFIKLAAGTWHAGPYLMSSQSDQVDFYNLELSDTNITDHDSYSLQEKLGVIYEIA